VRLPPGPTLEGALDTPADCFGDHAGVVASRKLPSFAVARNCGIGSSSLNADVNAFDRLHMVEILTRLRRMAEAKLLFFLTEPE
jgi:hypothetical protein